MFSPYYLFARRRGGGVADPRNHCCINVALYGPGASRWAMTERSSRALTATRDTLTVGPSALHWDGASLRIDFDEICMPVARRLRGTVRLIPHAVSRETHALSKGHAHVWRPIAPRARVELSCTHPDIAWSGDGYFDHNRGSEPIEAGFRNWIWSRAPHRDGAVVLYDGVRRDGTRFDLGLRFDAAGVGHVIEPPPVRNVSRSRWRMPRPVRSETPARLVATLEDAPFYARSAVGARVLGEDVVGVHESLSLDKFRLPIVQAMLPFRMPRRR